MTLATHTLAPSALILPYPGLRPFDTPDHPIFFGREEHVGRLLDLLQDERFVAVVGSSGSGKSSLVRAGLLPAIHDGFLGDSTNWLIPIIKPGGNPYERLARELDKAIPPPLDAGGTEKRDGRSTTAKLLWRTDHGLIDVLTHSKEGPGKQVILIVDQFEELFASRSRAILPEGPADRNLSASRDEAGAFVSMLLCSAAEPDGRIRVVITMRSDFIGECEAFLGLPEAVSRSQFLVPRLDRTQMEQAIVRPGQVAGQGFTPFTFEAGLVNRILNDAGDRPDQLPLTQHALMRTWKLGRDRTRGAGPLVLTQKDYEDAGGVEKALSLDAEAAWTAATRDNETNKNIVRRLFLLLCDVAPDGKIVRRRPELQEIIDATGATAAQIERVFRMFQADDRRFLLPEKEGPLEPADRLDVSHEALLRRWSRFGGTPVSDPGDVDPIAQLTEARGQQDAVETLIVMSFLHLLRWAGVPQSFFRNFEKDAWLTIGPRDATELRRLLEPRLPFAWRGSAGFFARVLGRSSTNPWLTQERDDADELCRLVAQSKYWSKGNGGLLTVKDLPRITDWESRIKKEWARRYVPAPDWPVAWDRIVEFIKASKRRVKFQLRAKQLLVLALVVATGYSLWQRRIAQSAANNAKTEAHNATTAKISAEVAAHDAELAKISADAAAERARTALESSFIRTIGLSADWSPTPEERGALWDLATLDPSNVAVRQNVVKQWFTSVQGVIRGNNCSGRGLHSAIGTNKALLSYVNMKAASESTHLIAFPTKGEQGSVYLKTFTDWLWAMAGRLDPQTAARVADEGAKVVLTEMEKQTDPYQIASLVELLSELTAHMDPQTAAKCAERGAQMVVAAMATEVAKGIPSDRLVSLARALSALAARMEPQAAAGVADKGAEMVSTAMEKGSGSYYLPSLATALSPLTALMDRRAATRVANKGAELMAAAMEKNVDRNRLSSIADALGALTSRLDPQAAAALYAERVGMVEGDMEKEAEPYRLASLASTFLALAAQMDAQPAAREADKVAEMIAAAMEKQTDSSGLSPLASVLSALVELLGPQAAARVAGDGARTLMAAMGKSPNSTRLLSIADGLSLLEARMDPRAAAQAADASAELIATAMEKETNSTRLSSLAIALSTQTKRTDSQAALRITEKSAGLLQAAMEIETDSLGLSSLAGGLSVLAARMTPQAAAGAATRFAAKVVEAMEAETDLDRLTVLSHALSGLAAWIDQQAATRAADKLVAIIERGTQLDRLSTVTRALSALAARLYAQAAAGVAERVAKVMVGATGSDHLSSLASVLSALTARLDPRAAAQLADRMATAVDQEMDPNRLSSLAGVLSALAGRMDPQPAARVTILAVDKLCHRFKFMNDSSSDDLANLALTLGSLVTSHDDAALLTAVSRVSLANMLLNKVAGPDERYDVLTYAEPPEKRRHIVVETCARLSKEDLAEVLKWPFCVGDAQKIMLAELEKKTGAKFNGDLWKFVDQVPKLGLKGFDPDAPAKRPDIDDAIREVESLKIPGPAHDAPATTTASRPS